MKVALVAVLCCAVITGGACGIARTLPPRTQTAAQPARAPVAAPQDSIKPGDSVTRALRAWIVAQQAVWDALPLRMPDSSTVWPNWQYTPERTAASRRCGGSDTLIAPDLLWLRFDDSTSHGRRLFIADSVGGRIMTRLTGRAAPHLVWIRPNEGCGMLSLASRLKEVGGVALASPDILWLNMVEPIGTDRVPPP